MDKQKERLNAIKLDLSKAFERVNLPINKINLLVILTDNNFKLINTETISIGIKRGSLGYYGRTHELNSKEINRWLNNYLKEYSSWN